MTKSPIVIAPKYGKLGEGFSKLEKLKAQEHPGRRTNVRGYQSAVSWIERLVAHKTAIILCSFCRHEVNPRKDLKYRQFLNYDAKGNMIKIMIEYDEFTDKTNEIVYDKSKNIDHRSKYAKEISGIEKKLKECKLSFKGR